MKSRAWILATFFVAQASLGATSGSSGTSGTQPASPTQAPANAEPPPPPPPTPGEWEVTFVDPTKRGFDQKFRHCFRAGEPPQNVLPPSKSEKAELKCSYQRGHKPKTNIITWSANCKMPQGAVTESGTFTYKEESYEGTLHATVSVPQMAQAGMAPIKTSMPVLGKRIGDCK